MRGIGVFMTEPCTSSRSCLGEILLHFLGSRPTARFVAYLVRVPTTIL